MIDTNVPLRGTPHPIDTRIRFIKAWGHPTRNEIYGPGSIARVSRRIADTLVHSGIVEIITEEEPNGGQIL